MSCHFFCPSLRMSNVAVLVSECFNMTLDDSITFVRYNVLLGCRASFWVTLSAMCYFGTRHTRVTMTQQAIQCTTMQHATTHSDTQYLPQHLVQTQQRCDNTTFLCSIVTRHFAWSSDMLYCRPLYRMSLWALSMEFKLPGDIQFGINRFV